MRGTEQSRLAVIACDNRHRGERVHRQQGNIQRIAEPLCERRTYPQPSGRPRPPADRHRIQAAGRYSRLPKKFVGEQGHLAGMVASRLLPKGDEPPPAGERDGTDIRSGFYAEYEGHFLSV